jgi:hypothetical protein
LKVALITTPILIKLDFTKAFILDVDQSTHGVGAILSHKEGRWERIIVYVSKGLYLAQKKFHPWRVNVMHWFGASCIFDNTSIKTTLSHVYGQTGRWINTIQHFSFKIVHKTCYKHTNINFNSNPMDIANE